jgi:hypothetical protein
LTSLVTRGIIIFMQIFKMSKERSRVEPNHLISQFPKNLNFVELCSEALNQSLAGDPTQVTSEFGPLKLNLDFHSGDKGYQIAWMLEPGKETLKIPEGKILQFEISQPGQEALTMTYDPSSTFNMGSFPLMKNLLPSASLQVKLVDKASSNRGSVETKQRAVGEKLSEQAA